MKWLVSLLLAAVAIPGTGNGWTENGYSWFGNQWCYDAGALLSPGSSAIDAGALIPGFHCPNPGPDPSGCVEWSGKAPDIGACEYVATATPGLPPAPSGLRFITPSDP